MKITTIKSQIVKLPADEPLANGPATPGATRDFVALTVGTDEGIEGIGEAQEGEAALTWRRCAPCWKCCGCRCDGGIDIGLTGQAANLDGNKRVAHGSASYPGT